MIWDLELTRIKIFIKKSILKYFKSKLVLPGGSSFLFSLNLSTSCTKITIAVTNSKSAEIMMLCNINILSRGKCKIQLNLICSACNQTAPATTNTTLLENVAFDNFVVGLDDMIIWE